MISSKFKNRTDYFFALCGLGYFATLPISNTIALRNVLLTIVLIYFLWVYCRRLGVFRLTELHFVPWVLIVWAIYLVAFPVFSVDSVTAWDSWWRDWGKGLMAIIAGAFLASQFSKTPTGTLQVLSVTAFVPIFLYYAMFTWKAFLTGTVPFGYTGVEVTHGVLSYSAGQAALLLSVSAVTSKGPRRVMAGLLLALTVLSMVLVRSRGGLLFSLIAIMVVFLATFRGASQDQKRRGLIAISVLAGMGVALASLAYHTDSRWQNLTSRLSAGMLGDALQVHCYGPSSIESEIEEKYGSSNQSERIKNSLVNDDGVRVLLFRTGLKLLEMHPWGLDGSRSAFQQRILDVCPDPVGIIANAHNGWLDTALAIGVPGAVLYFLVFIYFIRIGQRVVNPDSPAFPWALILIAASVFWMLRALVDSCFRDHMLEMQGFLLSYAAVAVCQYRENAHINEKSFS